MVQHLLLCSAPFDFYQILFTPCQPAKVELKLNTGGSDWRFVVSVKDSLSLQPRALGGMHRKTRLQLRRNLLFE